MSIVTITISIDTGKETPTQRRVRIAETQKVSLGYNRA